MAATKVAPTKLPMSTFDTWVAKQVRSGKVKPAEGRSKNEEIVLPKDTYEIWVEKQKPRESVQQKEVSPAPSTFDLWVSRQVAEKSSQEGSTETAVAVDTGAVATPQ